MAKLITKAGIDIDIEPKNGKDFTFEELYPLIAPHSHIIELTRLADGRIMLSDEEGKFENDHELDRNEIATALLAAAGGIPGDYVLGDVVICRDEEVK